MSLQDMKDLVIRAWAAYDSGDEDGFAACLSPGWVEHDNEGGTIGVDDERPTMRAHRVAFPDKHTEILHLVAEGDLVACRSTTTATHTGTYFDIAPTGKAVRVHEISLHRVIDGRITETWGVTSGGGFYLQLTGRDAPEATDNIG